MNKWKIMTPILVVALLALAFWYGGDAPQLQGWTVGEAVAERESLEEAQTEIPTPEGMEMDQSELGEEGESSTDESMEVSPESTDYVENTPPPVVDSEITDTLLTCTLSVSCHTILDHMDWLTKGKESLVPWDGVIFPATEVTFSEGESAFDVLLREMKEAGIHMEYENTPLYQSTYIEGIGNIYQGDCGQLSGWMYCVNGWFPNYGDSLYSLQDGDVVEWVYSCDLGQDVGNTASWES